MLYDGGDMAALLEIVQDLTERQIISEERSRTILERLEEIKTSTHHLEVELRPVIDYYRHQEAVNRAKAELKTADDMKTAILAEAQAKVEAQRAGFWMKAGALLENPKVQGALIGLCVWLAAQFGVPLLSSDDASVIMQNAGSSLALYEHLRYGG